MKDIENGYSYWENLAIAFDQLCSALIGYPCDETLSSVAYRKSLEGKPYWRWIIDHIFFWQENHCKTAYESELNRAQLGKEFK